MFRTDGALTSITNAGQNDPTDQRAGELHFEAFNHKSKLITERCHTRSH